MNLQDFLIVFLLQSSYHRIIFPEKSVGTTELHYSTKKREDSLSIL